MDCSNDILVTKKLIFDTRTVVYIFQNEIKEIQVNFHAIGF
jgi:hypothetical protein